jgi:hypothetical protein
MIALTLSIREAASAPASGDSRYCHLPLRMILCNIASAVVLLCSDFLSTRYKMARIFHEQIIKPHAQGNMAHGSTVRWLFMILEANNGLIMLFGNVFPSKVFCFSLLFPLLHPRHHAFLGFWHRAGLRCLCFSSCCSSLSRCTRETRCYS